MRPGKRPKRRNRKLIEISIEKENTQENKCTTNGSKQESIFLAEP